MPDKKSKVSKDPAVLKEKGIQAFQQQNYNKAIEFFTKAIEIDPKNPTLFSNRAASYIELDDFQNAIKDSEMCISVDPNFIKGYIRKAQSLREVGNIEEAFAIISDASKKFNSNEDISSYLSKIKAEYDEIHKFPSDHPEMKKFDTFFKWLLDSGSKFDKLQLRFYTLNYRGIHVRTKVKVLQ